MLDHPAELAAACRARLPSMNCTNGRFDPYEFDVAECQASLEEALATKTSSGKGCKKIAHTLDGVPGFTLLSDPFAPGPGQRAAPNVKGVKGLVESINVRPDRRGQRLCASCGSPHNLSVCHQPEASSQ